MVIPELLKMDRRKIGSIYCLFFIFLSYDKGVHSSNLFSLNLLKTWDGKPLTPSDIIPVTFSLESTDDKNIIITFNSTLFTDLEKTTLNPEVFGIMLKNEGNQYVHIQVDSASNHLVKLYNGFGHELQTQENLIVNFVSVSGNNTWNGTIAMPVSYLPRGTNEIAAYANFTKATTPKMEILTLRSYNTTIKELLPNLHKAEYFQEFNFQQFLPKVSEALTKWSPLWQELIHVSPEGATLHPNTTEAIHNDDHGNSAQSSKCSFMLFYLIIFPFAFTLKQ